MDAPSPRPIEQLWDSYVRKVYDGPIKGNQLIEVRRAFYAGCHGYAALLNTVEALAGLGNEHRLQMVKLLFENELNEFADDVLAGRK